MEYAEQRRLLTLLKLAKPCRDDTWLAREVTIRVREACSRDIFNSVEQTEDSYEYLKSQLQLLIDENNLTEEEFKSVACFQIKDVSGNIKIQLQKAFNLNFAGEYKGIAEEDVINLLSLSATEGPIIDKFKDLGKKIGSAVASGARNIKNDIIDPLRKFKLSKQVDLHKLDSGGWYSDDGKFNLELKDLIGAVAARISEGKDLKSNPVYALFCEKKIDPEHRCVIQILPNWLDRYTQATEKYATELEEFLKTTDDETKITSFVNSGKIKVTKELVACIGDIEKNKIPAKWAEFLNKEGITEKLGSVLVGVATNFNIMSAWKRGKKAATITEKKGAPITEYTPENAKVFDAKLSLLKTPQEKINYIDTILPKTLISCRQALLKHFEAQRSPFDSFEFKLLWSYTTKTGKDISRTAANFFLAYFNMGSIYSKMEKLGWAGVDLSGENIEGLTLMYETLSRGLKPVEGGIIRQEGDTFLWDLSREAIDKLKASDVYDKHKTDTRNYSKNKPLTPGQLNKLLQEKPKLPIVNTNSADSIQRLPWETIKILYKTLLSKYADPEDIDAQLNGTVDKGMVTSFVVNLLSADSTQVERYLTNLSSAKDEESASTNNGSPIIMV